MIGRCWLPAAGEFTAGRDADAQLATKATATMIDAEFAAVVRVWFFRMVFGLMSICQVRMMISRCSSMLREVCEPRWASIDQTK